MNPLSTNFANTLKIIISLVNDYDHIDEKLLKSFTKEDEFYLLMKEYGFMYKNNTKEILSTEIPLRIHNLRKNIQKVNNFLNGVS